MLITPFYAALFALLFVILSARTIRLRRRLRIAVGDGGNAEMLRSMRVHANFAEYVPLTLLLTLMLELQGGPWPLTHLFCLALLAGRLLHARGVSRVQENYRYRIAGMLLTYFAMVGCALSMLGMYAWSMSY